MKSLILPLVAGLSLLAKPARAVLVIDSFSGSTSGTAAASGPTAAFFGFDPFPDREAALTFTTGSSAAYLDELRLSLSIGDNSSALFASLSTGASAPGGTGTIPLGSFSPGGGGPTIQTASFTPAPNSLLLAANTEYWIHLTVPTGGGIYALTFSDTPSSSGGFSQDETWAFTPTGSLPPTGWNLDSTSGVARMQLEVTPVPEPAVAWLGGLGAFLMLRRRR